MIRVRVQLFGPLAEQAGKSHLTVSVGGTTVADVITAVAVAAPALVVDRTVRFAVNTDYAEPSTPVREDDLVSLIPPVGGG